MATNPEWIVVGGGIAGIAIAEILTREGHSVVLLEQGERLAGGTTSDLHEWIHTGCLYTLVYDRLMTMKYMLGAIDDLLEYYGSFSRMNLVPTERGLDIGAAGWFEPNYIHFRYRNRRFNPLWTLLASRSRFLIERIGQHDWLRRRAGVLDEFRHGGWPAICAGYRAQMAERDDFFEVRSTDFSFDSRMLLEDLVGAALGNGLQVRTGQRVREIRSLGGEKLVVTEAGTFRAKRLVLCAGAAVAEFADAKVTTTYAPMAVVGNLPASARSFVELDLNVRNCINLVLKDGGIGLAGGISLKRQADCDAYLDQILALHKQRQPSLTVLGRYTGVKSEITFPRQDRNYLFHIVPCADNMWATIPGKFTLAFSLAPEFYRRVYHANPRKFFTPAADIRSAARLIADVRWRTLARHGARDGEAAMAHWLGPLHRPGDRAPAYEPAGGS
jgi:glycine/D-amino acid oxidase-like deaminating enzyme